jgi:hypothetical protein
MTRSVIVTLVVLLAANASAQVPSQVTWQDPHSCSSDPKKPSTHTPSTLASSYYAGEWDTLQKDLKELLLNECKFTGAQFDLKKDYVVVMFTARVPKPDPEILHVIVHDPQLSAFSTTLPGVGTKGDTARLRYVLISDSLDVKVATMLASTLSPNPLTTQAGAFLQQFDFSTLAPAAKTPSNRAEGDKGTAPFATWGIVTLPFDRAAIAEADFLGFPAKTTIDHDDLSNYTDGLDAIQAGFGSGGSTVSACAIAVNNALHDSLKIAVGKTPPPQWKDLPGIANKAIQDAVKAIEDAANNDPEKPRCTPADFAQVDAIARAYRATFDDPKPEKVTGTAALTNLPLTWLEFTAAAGVIVGGMTGPEPSTIDSKIYATGDPLSRAMTMGALEFHLPFDSSLASPSRRERVGFLVGGVIKPAGGFGAGVAFMIVRGLSVNVGLIALTVAATPDGKKLGDAPDDANKPFVPGWKAGAFVGGNYTFGK